MVEGRDAKPRKQARRRELRSVKGIGGSCDLRRAAGEACVVVVASRIVVVVRTMRAVQYNVPAGAIDSAHKTQRDVAVRATMFTR